MVLQEVWELELEALQQLICLMKVELLLLAVKMVIIWGFIQKMHHLIIKVLLKLKERMEILECTSTEQPEEQIRIKERLL